MMNKISPSSDKSPNPDSGVTDSLWEPSWWQWLISALSGTVETEKQIAWLKKTREEAKKTEEEAKKQHEQRMKELREETAKYSAIAQQIEKENERLAVLESKIEGLFSKYGINSNPAKPTEEP
jgi:uncharacterized protein YlxW (UPF0749 family)